MRSLIIDPNELDVAMKRDQAPYNADNKGAFSLSNLDACRNRHRDPLARRGRVRRLQALYGARPPHEGMAHD